MKQFSAVITLGKRKMSLMFFKTHKFYLIMKLFLQFLPLYIKSGSHINVPLNDRGNNSYLKILTIKSKKLIKIKQIQK